MVAYPLPRLSAGEIISTAVGLCARHFVTFFLAAASVLVPVVVLRALMQPGAALPIVNQMAGAPVPADQAAFVLGAALLTILLQLFATGIMTVLATEALAGRSPSMESAYRSGLERSLPLLWTMLVFTFQLAWRVIGILIGLVLVFMFLMGIAQAMRSQFFAFIVGLLALGAYIGVIVYTVRLAIARCLYVPVVMVEQISGRAALSRSAELVEYYAGRVFGTLLLAFLIVAFGLALLIGVAAVVGVSTLSASPGSVEPATLIGIGVAGAFVEVLAGMFTATVTTVLYFDQRQRQGETVSL